MSSEPTTTTTPAEGTNFVRVGEHEPQEVRMTTTDTPDRARMWGAIELTVDVNTVLHEYDMHDEYNYVSGVRSDRVRAMAAEIVALRKDKARLDWLDKRCTELGFDDDERTVHVIHGGLNDRQWSEAGRGNDLRDAIDAAMEAP